MSSFLAKVPSFHITGKPRSNYVLHLQINSKVTKNNFNSDAMSYLIVIHLTYCGALSQGG